MLVIKNNSDVQKKADNCRYRLLAIWRFLSVKLAQLFSHVSHDWRLVKFNTHDLQCIGEAIDNVSQRCVCQLVQYTNTNLDWL